MSKSAGFIVLMCSCSWHLAAEAQSLPAASDEQAGQEGGVPEVVVTAQRRTERLQDVPIAVTAFSGSALQERGMRNSMDLEVATPGLTMTKLATSSSPFLRGVGTQGASTPGNEAPVALYVDGVYYPSNDANILSFSNVERVEVLKGPQGTLFGRNSTGGLINVTTRDPKPAPAIEGGISYGNYDTIESTLYATGGRGDFAGDIAVYYVHQANGFGTNSTTGKDVDRQSTLSLRSKLLWTPTEDDRFVLAGDWTHDESDFGLNLNAFPGSIFVDGVGHSGGPNDSRQNLQSSANLKAWTASFKYVHEFSWGSISSLTSYRDTRFGPTDYDFDGTPLPLINAVYSSSSRNLQQEILLTGRTKNFDYTGGVFLYDADQGFHQSITGSPIGPANNSIVGSVNTRSYALFFQGAYSLGESTRLTGGARYTIEKRRISAQVFTEAGFPGEAPVGSVLGTNIGSKSWRNLTWRLSLDHKISPSILTYVSFDRGFKAGVFNLSDPLSREPVNPEKLDSIEVGIKADLFDRILRANLAVFHYKYRGIQLTAASTDGLNILLNAAKAKLDGLELETTFAPPVSFGDLVFTAGLSMMDGKYTDFPNGPAYFPTGVGGNTQAFVDLSGNRMIRTPKWTLSLGTSVAVPVGAGEIGGSINYFHSDGYFWEPDNRLRQKPYDVLNAQLYFRFGEDLDYRIRVFGRNLTNEHYGIFAVSSGFGDAYTASAPRTYGVGVDFKF